MTRSEELLAEIERLRAQIAEKERSKRDLEVILETTTAHADSLVEQLSEERNDLEVMLEMTTAHADDISERLEQERADLETILDVTTQHSDAVEEELHIRTAALEAQSRFIREIFGRYVSDDVVAQLLDDPARLELGGEKRVATVMMSDLRGYTAVAARLDPQQVVRILNLYLEAMVDVILAYQGTLIEILGDGIFALFGAPITREDDAERAVACALAMQLRMAGVNDLLRRKQLPELEMGIGLHTGDVVVGNLGSKRCTRYAAVGSTVNLTGRIESCTVGNQVFISAATYEAAADKLTVRRTLTVDPKGVSEPIRIYDVGGLGGRHQLYLPDEEEYLAQLAQEIPVTYQLLEGKAAGQDRHAGSLVKLGKRSAELCCVVPVDTLCNLKLTLLTPHRDHSPGAVFAKVLESNGQRAMIRFTSVPQELRTFLDAAQRPQR